MEWYHKLNLVSIDKDARRRILEHCVDKYGKRKVMEKLGVSKSTLWRYLEGKTSIPDEKLVTLLGLISRDEFERILPDEKALEALGIVKDNGAVNYRLVLALLKLIDKDEYLASIVIRYVFKRHRQLVLRIMGLTLPSVKLEWTKEFEQYLRKGKKGKKVKTDEQIRYYRNLFAKYFEGKVLSEELVREVSQLDNGWARTLFRHYARYLYRMQRLDMNQLQWILEIVPSRSYVQGVESYPVTVDDIRKTLEYLVTRHSRYYLVYRLMLESGARFLHVLRMLSDWNPEQYVRINKYLSTKRLVCFDDKGFCRYFIGLRESNKTQEWIYFSLKTLEMLREKGLLGKKIHRKKVWEYAKRHRLLPPKMVRKIATDLMDEALEDRVVLFIQGRLGELRIRPSDAAYRNLLQRSDTQYPNYLENLKRYNLI